MASQKGPSSDLDELWMNSHLPSVAQQSIFASVSSVKTENEISLWPVLAHELG